MEFGHEVRPLGECVAQGQALLFLNVEKGHLGALLHECGDKPRADAGGAAGDDDSLALQTRIDR